MSAAEKMQPDSFWRAKDVARFLSVSEKWVYKHAAAGTLPNSRFGSNLRFDPEEIRAYAAQCSRKAKTSGPVIPFNAAA